MALLVLFSTVSFTVEKHFCGDSLVDISYFGNNTGCNDILEDDNCGDASVMEEDNCCKDEIQKIEGQDDLDTVAAEKLLLKKQFALLFTITYTNLFLCNGKHIVDPKQYSPPYLTQNIRTLYQVFII